MEVIRTGNTTERLVRNGIFTLMVVGFAAYCFYDWKIGYPGANLKQAVQDLPPEEQAAATINPRVTTESARQFQKGDALEVIEAELGPPSWKGAAHERLEAVWIGPGISMQVVLGASGRRVAQIQLKSAKHTETDLRTQMLMGMGLGVLGIFLVVRMIYMFIEGAVLSEAGLKMTGKPLILFDAMNEWDASDYNVKGRIRLGYALNGAVGHVVLDDYKLREFKRVVATICERKGFVNPITSSDEPASDSDPSQSPTQS